MQDENIFLAEINNKFGKENDDLQSQIGHLTKYRIPKSLQLRKKYDEKSDDRPFAKWWKIEKKVSLKGKKKVLCTNDELEYESTPKFSEPEYEEKDEKGVRVCYFYLSNVLVFLISPFLFC